MPAPWKTRPTAPANPERRALGLAALGAAVCTAWVPAALAQADAPAWLRAELPGARLVGQGRLTFFGLKVYDARLWAAPAFDPARFEQQPFALALSYLRGLKGPLIAERSLK